MFVLEAAYEDALRFIGTVRGADESVSVEYTVVPVDELSVEVGEH
jgi:CopG family nickel-responsive transcriptional regulator